MNEEIWKKAEEAYFNEHDYDLNFVEDENGYAWDNIRFAMEGEVIGGFEIPNDGFVLVHKTQAKAPDGGTYIDVSEDVICYGYDGINDLLRDNNLELE